MAAGAHVGATTDEVQGADPDGGARPGEGDAPGLSEEAEEDTEGGDHPAEGEGRGPNGGSTGQVVKLVGLCVADHGLDGPLLEDDVGIREQDPVGRARRLGAPGEGVALAEPSGRERVHSHAPELAVLGLESGQDLGGAVGGPVVDDDDLRRGPHAAQEGPQGWLDRLGLVPCCDHDGDRGRVQVLGVGVEAPDPRHTGRHQQGPEERN